MRARVWLPEVGVFSAIDELAYQDARSTLWGWPGQSPYRYSDPSGRCPACVAALVTLIGFGVAAPSDTASAPADLPGMMAAVPGLGQAAGAGLRGIAGFLAPYVERTAPGLANALRGAPRASAAAEAAGGSCGGGVAAGGAAPGTIAQIAEGKSIQGGVRALNEAGASQQEAVQALTQIVANSGRELIQTTVQGEAGSVGLAGVQFVHGGATKAVVVGADGVARYGSATATYSADGSLVLSNFVPY